MQALKEKYETATLLYGTNIALLPTRKKRKFRLGRAHATDGTIFEKLHGDLVSKYSRVVLAVQCFFISKLTAGTMPTAQSMSAKASIVFVRTLFEHMGMELIYENTPKHQLSVVLKEVALS